MLRLTLASTSGRTPASRPAFAIRRVWRSDVSCFEDSARIAYAPEHTSDDNLKVLCQRCRLAHGAEHRCARVAATRRARRAIGDLFDDAVTGESE
ncbi:hypothetical protein F7R21_02110 [Burkholderia latens]|uniref:Uncharacterized protein n=1 Tax=Burkholderia latens TaxID=488446 RepID=A0A6H9SXK9_9BURK|nr:hypothetical protein F7R21_02110 [Burkholderia latens]HDR9879773.1 hypothetical protein [Burkholderia cenocepacia]HDR9886862.1 hypothetical protein [Burkholderia cenocepacia]